jgi:GNAT superfamily N-acetyltransferase
VAILFMEEVFFALDLDTQYTHPVNLGWINYFARWAYSPLFRMWWPLLKPMYAPRFTRFFEDQFGLARLEDPPSAVEDVTGTVGQSERGFAWACWLAEQKPAYVIPPDARVLSYKLAMKFRRQKVYQVQAGLLLVRIHAETALWPASDLYVPPGMWGAGIGEAFLQDVEGTLRGLGVKQLVVQLRIQPNDRVARKKNADAAQLYRCAHFLEAQRSAGQLIAGALQIELDTDLLEKIFGSAAESSVTWMVKDLRDKDLRKPY